jgi:hypothetical protein
VLPNWPDQDKAKEILQRLATDNGIVAIMEKHNWQVGSLEEMSPLEVTLLGLTSSYIDNQDEIRTKVKKLNSGFVLKIHSELTNLSKT